MPKNYGVLYQSATHKRTSFSLLHGRSPPPLNAATLHFGCPTLSLDTTTDLSQAEPYLEGFIKWDGCCELDQGKPHWCSAHHVQKHCDLLRYLYERAPQLMNREPEEPWGDSVSPNDWTPVLVAAWGLE